LEKVHDGKKSTFLAHIGSNPCSVHNNALKECHTLLNQLNHIANVFEVTSDWEKERNFLRFRTTVAAVKWLTS
jgi:hypothetical protein